LEAAFARKTGQLTKNLRGERDSTGGLNLFTGRIQSKVRPATARKNNARKITSKVKKSPAQEIYSEVLVNKGEKKNQSGGNRKSGKNRLGKYPLYYAGRLQRKDRQRGRQQSYRQGKKKTFKKLVCKRLARIEQEDAGKENLATKGR